MNQRLILARIDTSLLPPAWYSILPVPANPPAHLDAQHWLPPLVSSLAFFLSCLYNYTYYPLLGPLEPLRPPLDYYSPLGTNLSDSHRHLHHYPVVTTISPNHHRRRKSTASDL